MSYATSRCKSCSAEIVWVRTEQGNSMPVDAAPPLLGGNVELSVLPGMDPTARVLGETRPGLYVSHFSTCPQAGQHRKRLRPDGKVR